MAGNLAMDQTSVSIGHVKKKRVSEGLELGQVSPYDGIEPNGADER
jgi:hypothetical protein